MHRYHPAVEAGDDPEAILFDDCDRCDDHTHNPMDTLDRASRARLLHRGTNFIIGKDHFRSAAERRAWNNITVEDESPTERTEI